MKKLKSSGATLLMGAKFSKITPRYWCSVGCRFNWAWRWICRLYINGQ